jgi:hypothetical protein
LKLTGDKKVMTMENTTSEFILPAKQRQALRNAPVPPVPDRVWMKIAARLEEKAKGFILPAKAEIKGWWPGVFVQPRYSYAWARVALGLVLVVALTMGSLNFGVHLAMTKAYLRSQLAYLYPGEQSVALQATHTKGGEEWVYY